MAAILEATVQLLREDGLDALTMSRVAARAGSTLPSVYRYFPDRSVLIRALAEDYLEHIHADLDAALRGLRTREQARRAMTSALNAYHQAFASDAALRQIWAGTIADPALIELNVADSRRNGALLADRLGPFTALPDDLLLRRCTLVAQLTLATVAFAVSLEPAEGRGFVSEFDSWSDLVLLT